MGEEIEHALEPYTQPICISNVYHGSSIDVVQVESSDRALKSTIHVIWHHLVYEDLASTILRWLMQDSPASFASLDLSLGTQPIMLIQVFTGEISSQVLRKLSSRRYIRLQANTIAVKIGPPKFKRLRRCSSMHHLSFPF